MTLMELFEQAKTLAAHERETLANLLMGTLHDPDPKPARKTNAEIVEMLMAMEPIELVDPHITDPVEWVEAQRQKGEDRLKPYWNGDADNLP